VRLDRILRLDEPFDTAQATVIASSVDAIRDVVYTRDGSSAFATVARGSRSAITHYERAAIRARNRNAFTHVTWLRRSDIWLTQGYALVYPDLPIIGENYNDAYIAHLVDGMYAAMRAVENLGHVDMDRVGHGGHSYGAFTTANLLAHTPFFKAGIAGDGACNRSLTPTGFQSEPRDLWTAPHTHLEMSPFFRADRIEMPLLLYHGGFAVPGAVSRPAPVAAAGGAAR
jgi:hypothetical protein